MININEVVETNEMIEKENLDVRTITLGISLLDCINSDLDKLCDNIYNKIYSTAKDLVKTGEQISREFGIPIVNKRISVTPIALVGGAACKSSSDFARIAATLDKVAKAVGQDITLRAAKHRCKEEVFVQYNSHELRTTDIIEKAKKDFVSRGHNITDIKEIQVYIKPSDNAAYYVVNHSETGRVGF